MQTTPKQEDLNLPKNDAAFDTNYYFNNGEDFEKRLEKL